MRAACCRGVVARSHLSAALRSPRSGVSESHSATRGRQMEARCLWFAPGERHRHGMQVRKSSEPMQSSVTTSGGRPPPGGCCASSIRQHAAINGCNATSLSRRLLSAHQIFCPSRRSWLAARTHTRHPVQAHSHHTKFSRIAYTVSSRRLDCVRGLMCRFWTKSAVAVGSDRFITPYTEALSSATPSCL